MIKCPNAECGAENVDGTQFCEACGEELPQGASASGAATTGAPAGSAATASTGPTSAATSDTVKCPACDNMNPADNLICEVCGSELKPAGSTPPADTGAAPANATTDTATLGATTPVSTPAPTTNATPTIDPLATGTTVPSLGATLPDVSITPGVGVFTTSTSATAPDAMSGIAPDVNAASTSGMPVVATGDTTTAFDPTATATATGVPDVGVSAVGATVADPNATVASTDPALSATPATSTPVTPSGNLQPGAVKFTVEQGMTVGKQFVLGDNEILVGREDDEEGIYPDIDLSDQDEGFVHRKHAQLSFKDGALTVTHLGGANKTRVNNKPLDDNTPQPVNIGDKVSFGKVVMRVGSV